MAQRYLLQARIGSGRFGPVYRAVDTAVSGEERFVAVQLLWEDLHQHEWLIDRFQNEFARLRSWSHDNIVEALDFGRDEDTFYWVTAFVDGATLRLIIQDSHPDLVDRQEVLAVIRSVGAALHYAHARWKVHGAIGPDTVSIDKDLIVKVTDFAPVPIAQSARMLIEDLQRAALGPADRREDVYGLACLAYELLSGRHPYENSQPLEALQRGSKLITIDSLSRRQWKALRRALDLDANNRFASVAEFLNDFGIDGSETLIPAQTSDTQDQRRFAKPRNTRSGWRRLAWILVLGGVAGAAYFTIAVRPDLATDLWVAAEQRLQRLLARETPAADPLVRETVAPEPVQPLRETVAPEPVQPLSERSTPARPPEPAEQPDSSTPLPDPSRDKEISSTAVEGSVDDSARADSSEQAQDAAVPTPPANPSPAVDGFEFAEQNISVSEAMPAVSVVIRRLGSTLGESSVSWWTLEGTAIADEDYVSFGAQIETFRAGEEERTIYLPVIMDSIEESTELFYVQLGYDSSLPRSGAAQLAITVIDDDL